MFTSSGYFKTLETQDCWKKDSAEPICKRNKYGDAVDYRIHRGMLIPDKSMEYMSVNLIHNKSEQFNYRQPAFA